jgi:hypothetical protein
MGPVRRVGDLVDVGGDARELPVEPAQLIDQCLSTSTKPPIRRIAIRKARFRFIPNAAI